MEKAARSPSHPQTQGHHNIRSSALSFVFFGLRSARVVVVDFRLQAVGASPNARQPSFLCAYLCVRLLPSGNYAMEIWIFGAGSSPSEVANQRDSLHRYGVGGRQLYSYIYSEAPPRHPPNYPSGVGRCLSRGRLQIGFTSGRACKHNDAVKLCSQSPNHYLCSVVPPLESAQAGVQTRARASITIHWVLSPADRGMCSV